MKAVFYFTKYINNNLKQSVIELENLYIYHRVFYDIRYPAGCPVTLAGYPTGRISGLTVEQMMQTSNKQI